MVDVPVLQVTIDNAQYEAFVERVKQFRADEAETPKAWGETAGHVDEIQKRFAEMAEALAGQDASAGKIAASSKDAADGASTIGSAWGLMQVSARRFGGSLGGVTRDVVKWERAVTLFVGLTGAGSLYGLDKLASVAAARRRSAGGLGITPGQQAAFQVGFGRLGDPDALLAGFNRAAIDRVGPEQVALAALGVNPAGKNAYKLATETLPKIKRLAEGTEDKMLGPKAKSYGLESLGVDESTMRLLKRMSQAEFAELMRTARDNENPLDIPDSVGRAWQDLITQLDLAQTWLQTALADKLVLIEPGVSKLSDGLVGLIDKLLDKKDLSKWLDEVNTGLEAFARTIGADSGQAALKKALDHLKMSREDFAKLEKWFGDHDTELKLLMLGYAGYKAFTLGRTVGAVVGFGARAAGAAVGVVTSPIVAGAGAALVASTGAANAGEDEAARQRKYHQDPAQPKLPGAGGVGMRGRGNQDVPASAPGPAAKPNAPGSITPENHPIRYEGNLKIDDKTFHFASGGNRGAYSSPPGDQTIESYTPPGRRPGTIFNQGYFRIGEKYDPELGRNREGVLIHESSHGMNVHEVVSSGCFAVPRPEWPQLEAALQKKMAQLGGRAILRVGSDGNAEVVPVGTPPGQYAPAAQKIETRSDKQNFSPVPKGPDMIQDVPLPKALPTGRAGLASLGAHPNAKPPPTPAVYVTLNTTESQVTVHH